jgi:methionine-rich copper-binding protein CopC
MPVLTWDQTGERLYETGVKNGVLYVQDTDGSYPLGVAWNGLVSVTEKPTGAEATAIYADDTKYLNLVSAEEFGATIEAYTYPDEFAECDGSAALAVGILAGQQARSSFGMAYKTTLGNDIETNDYGYKLHLIYGALAAPSEKGYQTINDSPEAITFSWEVKTTPVAVTGLRPTASIVIDSTKVDETLLATLEDMLFGTAGTDPYLPLPNAIKTMFAGAEPGALELSTIVPADGAANVAIDANIVLTFNNEIRTEAVVVTKNDGTIVAGAKTWDATGKILTFNPTANLDNSGDYIVTIGGVSDIYGQVLAAVVKNFSTVAP